jgi:hypothetical protein
MTSRRLSVAGATVDLPPERKAPPMTTTTPNPGPNGPLAAGAPEDFAAQVALVGLKGLRGHVLQRRAEAAADGALDRLQAAAAELSRAIDLVTELRRELGICEKN